MGSLGWKLGGGVQWLLTCPGPQITLWLWTSQPFGITEQGGPIILGVTPRSQKSGKPVLALGLLQG